MLKNRLLKFIKNKKFENNIVFKIFEKHLDEILDLKEGRFFCSNFINKKIEKIINGEIEKSFYDSCSHEKQSDNELENIDRKIYLSKVTINGIKGFVNIFEYCKKTKNSECYLQPTLDFKDRKSAVIFGWNGEGKSSLTESIEFALTNNVAEQKRRGISNISEYLLNTDSKEGFTEVELFEPYNPPKRVKIRRTIKNKKDNNVQIFSDDSNDLEADIRNRINLYEEFFEKHFIERNRLENFVLSRGSKNREAYGKLIGLDDLSDFIKIGWKKYDSQCKDEMYRKQNEALKKYEEIKTKLDDLINKRIKKPIFEVNDDNKIIIESLGIDDDKDFEIIYDKVTVEIEKINAGINMANEIENLVKDVRNHRKQFDNINELKNQFFNLKNIDNLIEFYLAAEKVITNDSKECPLCGGNNLYGQKLLERVKEKLESMNSILQLKKASDEIAAASQKLYSKTLKYINDYQFDDFKKDILNGKVEDKLISKYKNLSALKKRYQQLESLKKDLKNHRDEYNKYQFIESQIIHFEKQLKEQEIQVLKEQQTNQLKDSFLKDIKEFEQALNDFYIEELSAELKDISHLIKEYYNKFETNEKMETVELKDSEKEFKFCIQFTKNGPKLDPLRVLSEGQLRCFGLAILMSVTRKFNTNFLILDDIVNAIDIEHRSNIINVLCEEMQAPYNKQLIITTHDKLFWEKLVNSAKNRNRILSFIFENKCMVIENTKNIDFEKIIQESIKKKDCRTALVYMRILLENIIYTMADGVADVKFKDKVYKYELSKVFAAACDCYPELQHIYNYFMDESNHIYWSILNQENHFWSEQSISLDCETIGDIFSKVKCVRNIKNFYDLTESDKNEIRRQKNLEKVDKSKFQDISKIEDFEWFDEDDRWTQDFKLLSEII